MPTAGQVGKQVEAVLFEDQVGDDHDGRAAGAQAGDQIPEAQVGFPVEALVGLIEQEHAGVVNQGQREVQLLPGAARQGSRRCPAYPSLPTSSSARSSAGSR